MIPKIIHYCWFGRNPMPPLAKKCIRSWKKYCKGYTIIEWNEDNFDLSSAPLYVRQAYAAKKWAFVTDYVRLKIVYDHGGIYLDTDVEVLRSLDNFLQHRAFFGFDNENYVATGLGFGSIAGEPILKEMMCDYAEIPFINPDGNQDLLGCPKRNTPVLVRHGLIESNQSQFLEGDIAVFSSDYFCPKAGTGGEVCITPQTYTIHHFSASWYDDSKKQALQNHKRKLKLQQRKKAIIRIVHFPARCLHWLLGDERFAKLKQFIRRHP